MVKIEKSVVINAPVDKVFEFHSNPENDPLWQTQVQEAKITSDGPMGVGTTTSQTAHFMGRGIETKAEVTAYEPNQRSSWKSTSGPISGRGDNIYEAAGEGQTKLTLDVELDIGGFFKVAEPLVARAARRQTEANLALLKDILEAEA